MSAVTRNVPGMDDCDDRDDDRTADLAVVLGMSAPSFARALGSAWRVAPGSVPHDFDADTSGGLDEGPPWHLGGDPVQLMSRVFPHGLFIALPRPSWSAGTHGLTYWPDRQTYIAREAIQSPETETLVRDLLRRRRSAFRYCRYCRSPTPPELLVEDSCMGCASTWEGIVY